MFLVYFTATFLGAAALTILFILYLGRRDTFLRYMIATVSFCLIMLAVDAVFFEFYDMDNSKASLWPAFVFDISFYAFCFFWILSMRSINGERGIIPSKVLLPLFIILAALYETMLMTGMIRPAIAAIMIFDVVILINGVYYMICGIRNGSRRYGRWMLIAAGAGMAVYAAWLTYQDYNLHLKLLSGRLKEWPHDYVALFAIVFEVAVLVYFFLADPMNLREENRINSGELKLAEQYNLTKREKEIAGMILKGLSNQQIADRAFIAETTVKKHVSNMFRKTGTKSRFELIAKLRGKE
ncbi:MAG: hypothetical protein IJF96_05245 [Firmicutes bacterium]|nr:hypothetical protein [Bacillota bacterium]